MINLKYDTGEISDDKAKAVLNAITIPAEKLEEMKAYTMYLRRTFPHMKPNRIKRKVAEYFKVKLI